MINQNKVYQNDLEEICCEKLPFEKLENKCVLVTGANGLVGSCIVDVLMKLNEKFQYNISVLALCRNEEKAKKRFEYYNHNGLFQLLIADITEPLPANTHCDYIIHAASNAHPIAYSTQPVETMKANLLGTIQLLDYAKIHGISRFLFISSSEIYGENVNDLTSFNEEDLGYMNCMTSRSCYPESKRAAETLCASYAKQYNIDSVVARLGYIYGITMNEGNTRADVQFINNAVRGQNIVMKSSGMQQRSYCYLADAVTGIFYILLKGKCSEAYNVSNNKSNVTIREFANTLAKEAKVEVVFENPADIEQQGYSLVKNSLLNSDKLSSLGWEARISLIEGIHRVVQGIK